MLELKRLRLLNGDVCFWAKCSFEKKDIPKLAGFRWDGEQKKWLTHQAEIAFRLYEYGDDDVKLFLKKFLGDNDLQFNKQDISWPEGEAPYPHQIEGTEFICSRKASYLAFDAGTGKTIIAALSMNARPGKVLIVCPAFLKYNWEAEIKKWSVRPLRIQILHNQESRADIYADVIIYPASLLHYAEIRKSIFDVAEVIEQQNGGPAFEWVFTDEAHYFKNEDTKRTKSLLGGSLNHQSKRVKWKGFQSISKHFVCLSGTPMPNGRPMELYPIVSKLAPFAIDYASAHSFGLKYCGAYEGDWGWNYNGATNLEELHAKLTKNFMLVKKLDDCVDLPEELPPNFIFLNDNRPLKERTQELALLQSVKLGDVIRAEALRDESFAERLKFKEEIANEEGREMLAGEFLAELRKQNGMRKISEAVSIIKEMLENGPVVVFGWHQEVLETLQDNLSKFQPYLITGKTPHDKRHKYVEGFQNGESPLMLANIQAAGVGLTMTKAYQVVFIEASFVHADNVQAIARLRRIGQTRQVQASFLVWPNSLDHLVLNAHLEKGYATDQVIK